MCGIVGYLSGRDVVPILLDGLSRLEYRGYDSAGIEALSRALSHARDFGRGANYPIALEGALKLKEISSLHAEGYPAGEMKQGPIAVVDEDLPVVALCPLGHFYEKMLSTMSVTVE